MNFGSYFLFLYVLCSYWLLYSFSLQLDVLEEIPFDSLLTITFSTSNTDLDPFIDFLIVPTKNNFGPTLSSIDLARYFWNQTNSTAVTYSILFPIIWKYSPASTYQIEIVNQTAPSASFSITPSTIPFTFQTQFHPIGGGIAMADVLTPAEMWQSDEYIKYPFLVANFLLFIILLYLITCCLNYPLSHE